MVIISTRAIEPTTRARCGDSRVETAFRNELMLPLPLALSLLLCSSERRWDRARRAASAPGTSASEVTVATAAMATSEAKRVMAGGKWGGGGKDGGSAREAESPC